MGMMGQPPEQPEGTLTAEVRPDGPGNYTASIRVVIDAIDFGEARTFPTKAEAVAWVCETLPRRARQGK
jgi:hypothetical protein